MGQGNSSFRSYSPATGMISLAQKSRTVSRRMRWASVKSRFIAAGSAGWCPCQASAGRDPLRRHEVHVRWLELAQAPEARPDLHPYPVQRHVGGLQAHQAREEQGVHPLALDEGQDEGRLLQELLAPEVA